MGEIKDYSVTADNNNSASPDGAPEGMLPSGVNNTQREHMARIRRLTADTIDGSVTTTGSSTAYVAAANRTISAYHNGLQMSLEFHTASGDDPTLNVDSVGAQNLVHPDGTQIKSGEIASGAIVQVKYDLANTRWVVQTAGVAPSDLLVHPTGVTTDVPVSLDTLHSQRINARFFSDISTAITNIGATEVTLIIDQAYTETSLTFPSTLTLEFVGAGALNPASGTVTINGPIVAHNHQIFGGAGTIAGLGAVGRLNVRWFGATGDGSTDDYASLQATIDAAESVSTKTSVYFPPGTYNSGTALTVTEAVRVYGESEHTASLIATGAQTYAIELQHKYAGVDNLKIANTGTAARGVSVSALGTSDSDIRIKDCRIESFDYGVYNAGADGIYVSDCHIIGNTNGVYSANNFLNSSISRCYIYCFSADNDGITLTQSTQQPEGVRIVDCTVLTPGGRPLVIDGGLAIYATNCIFDQAEDAVLIDGSSNACKSITFSGCWFGYKGSGYVGAETVQATGTVDSLRFIGCEILSADWIALDLDGSSVDDVSIIGCRITQDGTSAGCIGLNINACDNVVVIATRFIGGSGSAENLVETSATAIGFGNRFTILPDAWWARWNVEGARAQNIADDSFITYPVRSDTGVITVIQDESACDFVFRAESGASSCAIATANAAALWEATTGALDGTTGTDTKFIVSAHTDGNIYVENRRGGIRSVRIIERS